MSHTPEPKINDTDREILIELNDALGKMADEAMRGPSVSLFTKLKEERDAYRSLCCELLSGIHNLEVSANSAAYCYSHNAGRFAHALEHLSLMAEQSRELQDKAEQILQESSNG